MTRTSPTNRRIVEEAAVQKTALDVLTSGVTTVEVPYLYQ
jgi:hypothetical protein